MTPEVVGKLREVFLLDYTVLDACDHAGISKDAYYDECKRNPKLADEMERSQRGLAKAAKRALAIEIVEKKNGRLSLEYLKNKRPEEYRTKIEADVPFVGNVTLILPGRKPHPRIVHDED